MSSDSLQPLAWRHKGGILISQGGRVTLGTMINNSAIESAATLLLVRDAAQGLEVFMLERPARGAFPGVHVFPGGKVDAADSSLLAQIRWHGPDAQGRSLVPLHYWVAAVRECYEESGVLLASAAGTLLGETAVARLHDNRASDRTLDLATLCKQTEWCLEFGELRYFAHWITPSMAPRRFDTRFFVAPMPAGQVAVHAPGETMSGEWITAAAALARAQRGDWTLIEPTRTSLKSLDRYSCVAALLDAVPNFEHLPPFTDYLSAEGMQPIDLTGDHGS